MELKITPSLRSKEGRPHIVVPGEQSPDSEEICLVIDHLQVLQGLHAVPLLLLIEQDCHVFLLLQHPTVNNIQSCWNITSNDA